MGLKEFAGLVKKHLNRQQRSALDLSIYALSSIPIAVRWLSDTAPLIIWVTAVALLLFSVFFFYYLRPTISLKHRITAVCLSSLFLIAFALVSWYKPVYKLNEARKDLDNELYDDALKEYKAIIAEDKDRNKDKTDKERDRHKGDKDETTALSGHGFEAECGLGISQRFLGQLRAAKNTLENECLNEVAKHRGYNPLILAQARQALGHIYRVQHSPLAESEYDKTETLLNGLEPDGDPEVKIEFADLYRARAHLELEYGYPQKANDLLDKAESALRVGDTRKYVAMRARVNADIYRVRQLAKTHNSIENVDCASSDDAASPQEDPDFSSADNEYRRSLIEGGNSDRVSAHLHLGLARLWARSNLNEATTQLRAAQDLYGKKKDANYFGRGQVDLAYAKLNRQHSSDGGSLSFAETEAGSAISNFQQVGADTFEADALRERGKIRLLECKLTDAKKDFEAAKSKYQPTIPSVAGCIDKQDLNKLQSIDCSTSARQTE